MNDLVNLRHYKFKYYVNLEIFKIFEASITQVSPDGADGFRIEMADGKTMQFVCDSTAQRDEWVAGMAELLLNAVRARCSACA